MLRMVRFGQEQRGSAVNRVSGKRAVVIGAAGHIGSAISRRLAEEGAAVHVVDDERAALETASASLPSGEPPAEVHVADLRHNDSLSELFDGIVRRHGGIDILVNAAWGHSFAPIDELDEESWSKDLETNLSVTYRAIHAVAAHMKGRRSGRIITISSTAKDGVPWFSTRGHSSHAAARGGVVGLMRALSYELGAYGITVNCVVVGPLDNPKARKVFQSVEADDAVRVRPEDMIALGRFGTPLDVAHAVLFLASDEANYITGDSLYVSGGLYG